MDSKQMRHENLPMAILEAMSAGVPVVGASVVGASVVGAPAAGAFMVGGMLRPTSWASGSVKST